MGCRLAFADNMSTLADNMSAIGLAKALFSNSRIAILKELSQEADGLHLRELERRSGINNRQLQREVHTLRDAGILLSKQVGRQITYRLNPQCPIYNELRAIIRKTAGLAQTLLGALEPVSDRVSIAYVYGSCASGQETVMSDVDLMVVGELTLRELSSPIRQASRELQRDVNPTLYRIDEYKKALEDDTSFVFRVHHGSRVNLIGGDS